MANSILRAVILALVAALAVGFAAQAGDYRAPRTAFGQPDLQGLWSNAWLTRLERPKVFVGLEATEAEAAAYERAPPPLVVDDVGGNESEMWELGGRLARIGGRARSSVIVDPADGRLPYTVSGAEAATAVIRRDVHDVGQGSHVTYGTPTNIHRIGELGVPRSRARCDRRY